MCRYRQAWSETNCCKCIERRYIHLTSLVELSSKDFHCTTEATMWTGTKLTQKNAPAGRVAPSGLRSLFSFSLITIILFHRGKKTPHFLCYISPCVKLTSVCCTKPARYLGQRLWKLVELLSDLRCGCCMYHKHPWIWLHFTASTLGQPLSCFSF